MMTGPKPSVIQNPITEKGIPDEEVKIPLHKAHSNIEVDTNATPGMKKSSPGGRSP